MNKITVVLIVFLYPVFASIYYYLPPLTSIAAIFAIRGYEKKDRFMLYVALIYLFNLEINFSLPMFVTVIALGLYYYLILPRLRFYTGCVNCLRVLTILLYNGVLLGLVVSYEYLFHDEAIVISMKLLYNILFEFAFLVLL